MEKKREHRAMCVFDKLRQENNYFKDFSDSNEIERIAGEVRHQFELMDYPTPIAHILDKVGFKIYKENLSANISGVIGVSDSLIEARGCKRIMLINAYENRGHQRFTMAHELGHYIFDYDGKSDFADEYSLDKERLTSETEIRVNRFAAALLMPKDIFTDKYRFFSLLGYKKEMIVNELSDIFDVSETAILRRIGELGLEDKIK